MRSKGKDIQSACLSQAIQLGDVGPQVVEIIGVGRIAGARPHLRRGESFEVFPLRFGFIVHRVKSADVVEEDKQLGIDIRDQS